MSRRWRKVRREVLGAALPILRAVSPSLAGRALGAVGRIEHALVPSSRRRFDAAVQRWSNHLGASWDRPAASRALAANEVRWQARDLPLEGLSAERLDALVRVSGREHLDAALGEGRGVVLLANHFGSHLVPSHWLLRHDYPLRLYMERPSHVSRLLATHFRDDGPLGQARLLISRKGNTAESASSILRAVKVLRAGMILCLAGDVRWSGPNTASARFLGQEHTFTATWVALAAMTGAPVVANYCRMERDGRYELEFRPAFHVPKDAVASGMASSLVQTCLDHIEEHLRIDPSNGNEYVSWDGEERARRSRRDALGATS
jgi:KDO2-lipid IV(A) lauroyltransferase